MTTEDHDRTRSTRAGYHQYGPGRLPMVAIVGRKESSPRWDPEVGELAEFAGREAVAAGFGVVTGGHSGVMEYAARGAKKAGGTTLGILTTDRMDDANTWLDVVVPSGIGIMRNALTALSCDCMIGLPGGLGTMQELSYALDYNRPVLLWDSWPLLGEQGGTYLRRDQKDEVVAWIHARRRDYRAKHGR